MKSRVKPNHVVVSAVFCCVFWAGQAFSQDAFAVPFQVMLCVTVLNLALLLRSFAERLDRIEASDGPGQHAAPDATSGRVGEDDAAARG